MQKQNKQFMFALFCLSLSMILLTFASVPLYSLFCKATGFAGTTQRLKLNSNKKYGGTKLNIRFDANTEKSLPWRFNPLQSIISIKSGENILAFYEVENLTDRNVIGTAVYNVTPNKAGRYFIKIDCFCFQEQTLLANQKLLLPVSFYIDSSIDDDPDMSDVTNITLSYSFFEIH